MTNRRGEVFTSSIVFLFSYCFSLKLAIPKITCPHEPSTFVTNSFIHNTSQVGFWLSE